MKGQFFISVTEAMYVNELDFNISIDRKHVVLTFRDGDSIVFNRGAFGKHGEAEGVHWLSTRKGCSLCIKITKAA